MKKILLIISLAAFASCTMEPRYERPQAPVPFGETNNSSKRKITTVSWEEYFTTPDLQRVIRLALENNRDLRIANLNIEAARATYGIERANLFPQIDAIGSATRQRVPGAYQGILPERQYAANLTMSAYELDFFGRLRSLKKSAMEDLLATAEGRNVIKISLISETVNAYAQYLLDKELFELAEKNMKAQSERIKFVELRYQHGIASQADLLTATLIIETAKTNYETYKKLLAQDRNTLMLLTGTFESRVLPEITSVNEIKINEDLLDMVPSESLLSRPDIKQAEHILKAANANIGAARAAFFPSITLSGNVGFASNDLSNLFHSHTWSFTPQIDLPIFNGGKNIANLNLTKLRKKIEIAQYEKTIQTAFRETLDQLAERESVFEQMKSAEEILRARKKYYEITDKRHDNGISSAIDLLDSQIEWFNAAQNEATMRKNYLVNLVNLYKVFGGGSEVVEAEKEE